MKIVRPSWKDRFECRRRISAFPDATGSYDYRGKFQPNVGKPFALWMLLPITGEKASEIWVSQGISTQGQDSCFSEMQLSECHYLHLEYFKIKVGLFSYRWVGNVRLSFGSHVLKFKDDLLEVDIGSVGGDSQSAMWGHFRRVLTGKERLFAGTAEAAIGFGRMGQAQNAGIQ